MKNVKKIVLYSLIAIVLIGGAATKTKVFSMGAKKETKQVVAAINKVSVQEQSVKAVGKTSGVIYKATLEAYEEGAVNSKASGKVVQVLFENGKQVTQGETLIVLDDRDIQNQLRSAQSQLKVTESQLTTTQINLQKFETNLQNAQQNYDRSKALLDQGVVSKADFQQVETALKNAKTDYESGKAAVETSKANIEVTKATIANYQSSLTDTVITAPFSGVIDGKSVTLGQMVSPGAALAKVRDVSSVYAIIQVEQQNLNNVQIGQKAIVKVDNGSNASYEGIVKSIDGAADPASRVFNCKIQIDNKDNALRPGVFAKAQMVTGDNVQMLVIPIQALAGEEGKYYIFLDNNGAAKKQSITIGDTTGNMVEVKTGVKEGDKVITTNTSSLQDGDKIEVVGN